MITEHSGSLSRRLRDNAVESLTEKGRGSLEAKTAVGYLLILILVSLIGWLYLTQASQVTTVGYRIYELERERARLQRENARLMLEIAELERLEVVEARARQLGFVPPSQVEYLAVADYPAGYPEAGQPAITPGGEELALNSTPTRSGDRVAAAAPTGWWGKLVSQFNIWVSLQPGSATSEGTP